MNHRGFSFCTTREQKTKTEAGCIYYGWTIAGDKLFCREGYVDGAAANAHLENVGLR